MELHSTGITGALEIMGLHTTGITEALGIMGLRTTGITEALGIMGLHTTGIAGALGISYGAPCYRNYRSFRDYKATLYRNCPCYMTICNFV